MPTATAPPPPPPPFPPSESAHPPEDPPTSNDRSTGPLGDPSRTGTLWVGATGVSLLLAAAAVLTAVRWGDIGQTAKLGGFVAITLAMLFGGQRLQRSIPLTGRAIFHLGALLIPLDMAAVAVLAERTWQETLLLTSLTAVVSWYALLRVDPSPVLEWAARGSVVLAAAGVAAVTPLSMPLVLAVFAAVAVGSTIASTREPGAGLLDVLDIHPTGRSATTWTMLAGLVPLAAFVRWPAQLTATVDDLGFVDADRSQLVAASLAATMLAALLARWKPSLERGWAVVMVAVIAGTTAAGMFNDGYVWWFCVAVFFAAAEVVALLARRDPIWNQIVAVAVPIVEVVAGLATLMALVDTWFAPTSPMLVVSSAVMCFGWLTADRRRLLEPTDWLVGLLFGADWRPATFLVPVSALAVAHAASASGFAVSIVALAGATWATVTGRVDARLLTLLAAFVAAANTPFGWSGVVVFALSAGLMALNARLALRRGDRSSAIVAAAVAGLFTVALAVPLEGLVDTGFAVAAIAVAGWALGWIISPKVEEPATFPTRLVTLFSLIAVFDLDPVSGLVLCALVAVLAGFDAWRVRQWAPSIVSGIAIGLAGLPIGELIGFTVAESGVMMTAAAMVAVGTQIALPQKLDLPLGALAVTLSAVGLYGAGESATLLAPAIMLAGGTALLFGAANECRPIIGLGALSIIVGTWMQLALWDVTWLEAYLAAPALAALWAGSIWHRRGMTSWVAYAPTIALFGLVAILDRIEGGSAWHAVIAGGVGVLAVVAGGVWRLSGPLLTGTALIAAVTIYESLGPGSRVPTWGWLALGGAVLVAAAVQMERSETTPLEHGQRVLEVLTTRFS